MHIDTATEIEDNQIDHLDVQIKELFAIEFSKDVFEYINRVKSLKLNHRKFFTF